jgi:hypothetical protein
MRQRRLLVVAAAIMLVVVSVLSAATVIHVPLDQPTIQEGIDAAGEGDTVLVAVGTYTGTNNCELNFGGTNMVVMSESGAAQTTIDCARGTRAFCFRNGENAASIVDGFTIMHGYAEGGGAIYCNATSPTFRNCSFRSNRSPDVGGGMGFYGSSSLIENCLFEGNSSEMALDGSGGAIICAAGSDLVISNCYFTHNTSDAGGCVTCTDASSLLLTDCLLPENSADSGGALACCSGSTLVIEGCTIVHCIGCGGSGIFCDGGSDVSVDRTIIAFGYKGEAVCCLAGGTATLVCCDVFQNEYGNWVGCIAGQNGVDGNISEDPLFCGILNPDSPYSLQSDSPCAAENNPDCDGVGALGIGCGATPVEATSWGRVKTMFK